MNNQFNPNPQQALRSVDDKKVLVALSGGVDSGVAAWLLKQQGFKPVGLFMSHRIDGDLPVDETLCPSPDEATDARRVADWLGIDLEVVDFNDKFEPVIEHFIDEYLQGRTPNPCTHCNRILKFGALFDMADQLGSGRIATGHYARIEPVAGGLGLFRGIDDIKDQAYVLFAIKREKLSRIFFPIGQLQKSEIRKLAIKIGLPVAEKPDSQDICFIPDGDHAGFIRRRRSGLKTAGQIVTTDGTVVGEHDGFERYTVGQRKGLGVAMGEPYFIVRIEPETNRVVIGQRDELATESLTASEANWLIDIPDGPFDAEVKIRYRSRPVAARVVPIGATRFEVKFQEPCYGVAPGQAAVCYRGDQLLGGGWID
jgi:tRNA-uridine 2-sulfurtransferase